jgi:hypothetical protein
MCAETKYYFSWQNPFLRASIYPFRNEKLRDFLIIYYEIDLWKQYKSQPPDALKVAEIRQEYTRIEEVIAEAKLDLQHAQAALKVLEAQNRQLLGSEPVRLLLRQKNMLLQRRSDIEARILPFERQVDWYQRFAQEHPYLQKWEFELSKLAAPMQEVLDALSQVEQQLDAQLAEYRSAQRSLESRIKIAQATIAQESMHLQQLPALGSSGQVGSRVVVQWEVARYRRELEKLEHDDLIRRVVDLLDSQKERFPIWVQYMVLHFSGMRYRSAHGSWADATDLLEMMRIESLRQESQSASEKQIAAACLQALNLLDHEKSQTSDPEQIEWINFQMMGLMSTNQRAALLKFNTSRELEKIHSLTEEASLEMLKAMHAENPFPDWVWAEIVSRTELRLDVKEEGWEELNDKQRQSKWLRENSRWRAIMNTWQNKDITGWRKQHWLTLSLIVTRAVCNEIAEHIQHLRGVKPAAGLTAKPGWYLSLMRKKPEESYLRRPMSAQDFLPGASILFLGWTDRRPNPWQIALRLSGIELLPEAMRPVKSARKSIAKRKNSQGTATDEWTYRESGNEFIRTMRPYVRTLVPVPESTLKKLKKQGKSDQDIRAMRKEKLVRGESITEWLRWTHEATVIDVIELSSGTYVLTFETGKIGVNLRPLTRLVNSWDVMVGYTPPSSIPEAKLAGMLSRKKILANVS